MYICRVNPAKLLVLDKLNRLICPRLITVMPNKINEKDMKIRNLMLMAAVVTLVHDGQQPDK